MGNSLPANDGRAPKAGKGHPPREFQFARGTSGNPKGRPRGALGLKGQLRRQLAESVQTKDGGTVPAAEAIAKSVISLACQGDLRAVQLLLSCSTEDSERADEPTAAALARDPDETLIDDTALAQNMKNRKGG